MKLGGLGDRTSPRRSRRCRSRPRSRRCSRRSAAARSSRSPTGASTRTVEPWGLRRSAGTGTSSAATATAARSARSAPTASTATSRSASPTRSTPPADFRPDDHVEDRPWLLGDDDPGDGPPARRRRPRRRACSPSSAATRPSPTATRRHRRSSSSTITNRAAFRSFVLGFLEHAEVLAPPDVRADVVAWLETSARSATDEPAAASPVPRSSASSRSCRGSSRTRARPRRRSRSASASRVEQLDEDLALVLMIGVPPYSPGDYLDVDEDDDGGVTIRLADYFRRPLRLTPAEGLALLAAGRALLAVPGSDPAGPLATALGKLEARARPPRSRRRRRRARRTSTRSATRWHHHERIEIDYWSAGRDELTTRAHRSRRRVLRDRARGTSSAYCHRADDERMFRVDRIRGLRATGEHFERGAGRPRRRARSTTRAPTTRGSRCALAPAAAWVAEAYPTESVTERPDGTLEVVLAVSEPAWLERLLLRLGPDAEVVDPPGAARAAGADAAAAGPRPLYRGSEPVSSSSIWYRARRNAA